MSDGALDDPTGNESSADELLSELIPGESEPGEPAGMVTGMPTWSGTSVSQSELDVDLTSGATAAAAGLSASAAPQPEPSKRRGDPRWLTITLAILAGIALLAVAYQAGLASGTDSTETAEPAATGDTEVADGTDEPESPSTVVDTETTTDGTITIGSEDLDEAPAGTDSTLRLTLDNYRFTVEGVVPSEEIKAGIEQRMGMVFAEFGESTLSVDPEVSPAPWLDAAPSLVNTMILLHDGMIDIAPDGVNVSGRALASDFEKLQGALAPERGFPALTIADQEVVDQPAPWVRAVATGDGTVTMTGELADEMMRSTIVEGSQAVYGVDNVIDRTTVNPERHNRFLIMRFPSNLSAYQAFGEFDIRGEKESFTAILENGLVFEILETELTPESRERLAGIMFTLTRNPLPVSVIGHTDSIGSATDNQGLSEVRADSVAAFLTENGVLPENISTSGLGESDPIGDNSTPEGRARNRRVEITIGLYN